MPHTTNTPLTGYAGSIAKYTGQTDPETLAEIEDIMRNVIFHSTLDWQTPAQFARGAREAWDVVSYTRTPEGIAEMARLDREIMGDAPQGLTT
jgi:hypothetical protein